MGWVGSVLLVISIWLVGNKKRKAFIFGVLGNLFWAISGYQKDMNDLIVISLIMVVFNAVGWFKWGSENHYWNRMVQDRRKYLGKFFWET